MENELSGGDVASGHLQEAQSIKTGLFLQLTSLRATQLVAIGETVEANRQVLGLPGHVCFDPDARGNRAGTIHFKR